MKAHQHRHHAIRVPDELLNEVADMYVSARRARPVRFPQFCCYLDDIMHERRPDLYDLATQKIEAKARKRQEAAADVRGDGS